MPRIAQVRILSPLPQLDKIFDYLIPDHLDIQFGNLVKVPFGKSAGKLAVVVGKSDDTDYAGELSSITSLESQHSLLTSEQHQLLNAVAERFAGSVSDLLKDCLPTISKAVDRKLPNKPHLVGSEIRLGEPSISFLELRIGSEKPWTEEFIDRCLAKLSLGQSALVVLPDYREEELFQKALEKRQLGAVSIRHNNSAKNSEKYLKYLFSLSQPAIVFGSRSTCFKPAFNLGLILLLDDADESHQEIRSPYWISRDVLLLRQRVASCDLLIAAHAPSADTVRLIELGFAKHLKQAASPVAVRCTETQNRLDDETFGLISSTIKRGKSVLIQVASLGYASFLICANCKQIRTCPQCNSRIWIDPTGITKCRTCSFRAKLPCSCGSEQIRVTRTGSTAMANWLQKAFPNIEVIHSTGQERITELDSGAKVVIATPGAEPNIDGGYTVVILADAVNMLGVPSLRATEHACQAWSNAAAKVNEGGIVIFVGLQGVITDQLRNLNFFEIIKQDCNERRDLELPPYSRLASILLNGHNLEFEFQKIVMERFAGRVKHLSTVDKDRVSFLYQYKDGKDVAEGLRNAVEHLSQQVKSNKTNRKQIKVIMDDWQAI